jgi:hypothetical protein
MRSNAAYNAVRSLPILLVLMVAAVARSAHAAPPQQAPLFSGAWSSTECEPRPGAPFAQRELTISGETYRLDLISFADARCTIPTLRARYEGRFAVRNPSSAIPEAWEVEFTARQVLLTPYVLNTADFLNSAPRGTCGREQWFVSLEQELAATSGCPLIGIDLRRPFVEYDIATIQGDRLLLGRRPPDGGYLFAPERRPIAFGPSLLRTGNVAILLPEVGEDRSFAVFLIAAGILLLVGSWGIGRTRYANLANADQFHVES